MGFRIATPDPTAGYNRATDWPTSGGAGSSSGYGAGMGFSQFANQTINTDQSTAGGWHPTVLWMLGFVVAEMVAFHLLSRVLNI